ncbi:hypothetical protein A2V49_00295 [candidate division WWE3 bacterium RBG_19FT_COMBO_34_6]|uniref:Uncharacterized protein n=1 Tax=candidate division WWE3 bacterium RBG_19FT_COMBO_34_6 TaxID=1802612 RepID=A0A1F4UJJ5_UNCKA|nr:MAG: hypothetical protein A2V49_00295 [candidate division WWE3 bacterium RBG_19FT_COMBO_34_6]
MRKNFYHKKIFGGTNFLVVLWTLISFLRFGLIFGKNAINTILDQQFFVYVIPLVFLLILNLMISIGSFFPNFKDKIWALSIIIATATLMVLNTFQTKVENIISSEAEEVSIYKF